MADRKRKVGIDSSIPESQACSSTEEVPNGLQKSLAASSGDSPATAPRDRRVSEPCGNSLERRKSFDEMPHLRLKVVKSTPQSFAPICVIGHAHDQRNLHGCLSHCYLPHLNKRKMSCPNPSPLVFDAINKINKQIAAENAKQRRHSYAGENKCQYKHGGRLHRCSSHYKTGAMQTVTRNPHRLLKQEPNENDIKRAFSEPNMYRETPNLVKDINRLAPSHSLGYMSCSLQSLKVTSSVDLIRSFHDLLPSITEEGVQLRFTADY